VTEGLNLANAGLEVCKNGKFRVDDHDRTNVENIYAIGDVQDGKLELTPTAIQAGRLLVERLFSNGKELMDYVNVPTTVFTPLEYGTVGLSEEEAREKFKGDLKVYHIHFKPLEWALNWEHGEKGRTAYTKVCV